MLLGRLFLVAALVATLTACHPSAPGATSPRTSSEESARNAPEGTLLARSPDEGGPIPIYPEDARWGSATAPVTIVAVLDLECPFCERAEATLEALRQHYGPERLRIVVKHYPLPFHQYARAAALTAIGVQRTAGDEAFFRFLKTVYAHQAELDGPKLTEWARDATQTGSGRASGLSLEEQLGRDLVFAARAGVTGTPCFFVNGAILTGAQPYEQFSAVIDAELTAMQQARLEGKSVAYPDRTTANFVAPSDATAKPDDDEDSTVWKIPVGTSPVLGPADALVTIVEFSDYECPFCKKVEPTLETLRGRYGSDLRLVFKHNPLPFHAHARPAAELALEAYHQKGNPGFWGASKALFDASAENMTDDGLLRIAAALGLDSKKARAAIQKSAHDAEIEVDTELALDFNARGTPHFFINGRRLAGAQPLERFVELVDAQLAVAKLLVQKGVPRSKLYEMILEHAEEPAPPTIVDLGPLPKDHAFRGPANAPVVVREFSDFQCPFCNRVLPTLEALRKEFPREVKIVWHNLPLDFHARARAAANAALEARALGGDTAFWKMHDLLFANQADLSDDKLAELGKTTGVSATAILTAVREGRHDAVIDEDKELAERAGIHGTPGFVINGYIVSGAQPLAEFRRTVRRALADHHAGVVPKPNSPQLPLP